MLYQAFKVRFTISTAVIVIAAEWSPLQMWRLHSGPVGRAHKLLTWSLTCNTKSNFEVKLRAQDAEGKAQSAKRRVQGYKRSMEYDRISLCHCYSRELLLVKSPLAETALRAFLNITQNWRMGQRLCQHAQNMNSTDLRVESKSLLHECIVKLCDIAGRAHTKVLEAA